MDDWLTTNVFGLLSLNPLDKIQIMELDLIFLLNVVCEANEWFKTIKPKLNEI